MQLEHIHHRYAGAFVEALSLAGVRNVCFAPGSRSTPLAVMLAEHAGIRLWTHLDERSAGFFALGMAKASGEPVGLLCSSGTATANFYPAVIEARYSRIPLIVMTADRPPELQDVGAPQTIDQQDLYGKHVKWHAQMALPEASSDALRYVRSVAGRAVATALAEPRGAVHLNFPFREPLMPIAPVPGPGLIDDVDQRSGLVTGSQGRRGLEPDVAARLAGELSDTTRGLIVCGPQDDPRLGPAVTTLAEKLGYPVLADPLSGVRCGRHLSDLVLDSYDAFLKDKMLAAALEPEVVIRFGAQPTVKPFLLYAQRHSKARYILVDGGDGWNDPARLSNEVAHADPVLFCQGITSELDQIDRVRDSGWMSDWIAINRATRETLHDAISEFDVLFEGRVFQELATIMPEPSTVFAGNSMPVRDLDTFFPANKARITFLSNRGANGIDGVISSALGASTKSDGPLVLVIGDLSFYHDMNGLLAAKLHDLNATIIVINNDGGGIFSFLPQAEHPAHFEALFGTPHGLDFQPAADLYGLKFRRITDWGGFRESVSDSIARAGVQIIEVPAPDRTANVALHRELWERVRQRVARLELQCLAST